MILTISDDFDLNKIADSGQCFRWEKLEDGGFRIPLGDRCLIIRRKDGLQYEADCTEDEFAQIWRPYFDLDTDYRRIRERIPKSDRFLCEAAQSEKGIRILRQDPWETLISFIISQNRNIPAIKKSVELLCEAAGRRKKDSRGKIFYSFPSPKEILKTKKLCDCKLGYRDGYVRAAAEMACEGLIDPADLAQLTADDLREKLKEIRGVGEKVAQCVVLFGFHQLDAFPIDTWMRKILENEYPDGYPAEEYSPYNGVYQQFMFAYYRKK